MKPGNNMMINKWKKETYCTNPNYRPNKAKRMVTMV